MSVEAVWLAAVAVPPLAFLAIARLPLEFSRLRAAAAVCALVSALACAAVLVVPELAALHIAWPVDSAILGPSLLRVSELSAPLIPLPSTLWLLSVATTPRSRLDAAGLRRTAIAALVATIAFSTESPALLVLLWMTSNRLLVAALAEPAHRRARRVARVYLWTSAIVLALGALLATLAPHTAWGDAGLWLVIVAVLIRKGIFPFHAWIPEVFDTGRIGPIVRFSAPQLGAYVAVVLVVPHASPAMLRTIAILSLVTAVYGAALALVQRDARRACGYLFVSQSALVLAGIDGTSPQALAGSLVIWISSALAFAGLARAVLALEARRGRLDLTRYHGGYAQAPALALSFLVLGLACTGFPGTLGFVGQELLIEGAVQEFPALGFFVVIAATLTGLAVLRMYFSLFCGTRSDSFKLRLFPREVLALGAVVVVLVAGGLVPGALVPSRLSASHAVLDARQVTAPGHR